jgi:1-acyl-sn-glycerol-3-phosphate acyltransferase
MFVPPRHHPILTRVCDWLLPTIAHTVAHIRDVRVPEEDLARLEELRANRAILSPNHPTGNDPLVLMWLSRLIRHRFNYLAAREVLDGPKGWLLNQVGAYSVIRGIADRESLRYTRRLLAEMDRTVVIFPEGEIYEHNDTLLAFQSGVAQIGFWALDDVQKLGKPPLMPIVPVAFKYRCCDSPRAAIENSLRGLEDALNLPPLPKAPAYARLRRAGERILAAVERDLDITAPEGASLRERIQAYREKLIRRVARAIDAKVDLNASPAEQLHGLYHDLRSWVGELPEDHSAYDEVLYRRRIAIAAPLFFDLQRLQSFIALSGEYVAQNPTAERFLEVLGRLESEVFGEVRHRVVREAVVRIAPPIRLEDRYDAYRKEKRQVVADVTREMEASIRDMLHELSREATPIALDA